LDFNHLMSNIESGKISPYQIYNLDVDYPQVFSANHYIKNKNDNIDQNQKLHRLFLDIEVISDNQFDFDTIENGKYPISSFTLFSTYEKVFHSFFLLTQKSVDNWNSKSDHTEYFKKQLVDLEYLKENDFDVVIKTYTSDLPLLKDAWQKIHELDPVIISGFNSDGFDLPYIFYRLKTLYNGDTKSVSKIMSKFGEVSINKWGGNRGTVRLNEFINADLGYLYRPRDDGGLVNSSFTQ
jgi:DNA polymerase elongation subunit (family B)